MSTTDPHFDLAVIGGGPAGASAAITAARSGARTVLFEAKEFPRHKVCGEFVSAESLDVLSSLLQGSPVGYELIQSAPRVGQTRLFLGGRMIEARLAPPAVSITRYDLDAALWQAASEQGVEAVPSCEVASLAGEGPFTLATLRGTYTARAVIIAAGRWSQFTPERSLPAGPKWIGLKGHFRENNPPLRTDLYFFQHGYCGVQPLANDTVNACAMVRSDEATSLTDALNLHPRLAERATRWVPATQPMSTAPLVYRAPLPTQANKIFAGDAAAFIDPFVGDGISIALRSGRAAAGALDDFFFGKTELVTCVSKYAREYNEQFAPLIATAAKVRGLLSLPVRARAVAFELLRFPGILPIVIRKTRRAS
jgi:flavin-dependent dehydrogenase